ncbi:uncharacterized protein LOC113248248 [Ursus arctos]|uniref:uncharacterized protein LOC113248248 n=1 Tax=Ursus arctos TaxID=9644 RepID=UPI00254839C2|nr:uncharacterized protein LOC113248248 [Ursus arctos]
MVQARDDSGLVQIHLRCGIRDWSGDSRDPVKPAECAFETISFQELTHLPEQAEAMDMMKTAFEKVLCLAAPARSVCTSPPHPRPGRPGPQALGAQGDVAAQQAWGTGPRRRPDVWDGARPRRTAPDSASPRRQDRRRLRPPKTRVIPTAEARARRPALPARTPRRRRANKGRRRARGAPPSGRSSRGGPGAAFQGLLGLPRTPSPRSRPDVWPALRLPSLALPGGARFDVLVIQAEKKPSQAHVFSSVRQRNICDILKQLKKYSVQSSEGGNREAGDKRGHDECFHLCPASCFPKRVHTHIVSVVLQETLLFLRSLIDGGCFLMGDLL